MIQRLRDGEIESAEVDVTAPVRVVDFGGWTDTWFAEHGSVFNLAVWSRPQTSSCNAYTGVTASATFLKTSSGEGSIALRAMDPGIEIDEVFISGRESWDTSNLLQAALSRANIPEGLDAFIEVSSNGIPPGASVGTSAAVSTAVIAAMELAASGTVDPAWLARETHQVETRVMGVECGVQDQVASAYAAGAVMIHITHYPDVVVTPCRLHDAVVSKLEDTLLTVTYGEPHVSSDVHEDVIRGLKKEGRLAPRLERLRLLSAEAQYCLVEGDLDGFGQVMSRNTECQRKLHPDLISNQCHALIDKAVELRALGWKVNGAGGLSGGSLTILLPNVTAKRSAAAKVRKQFPESVVLEHKLARTGIRHSIKVA